MINGFFFVFLTLTFIGPGQMLGRAFGRIPDRLRAYTVDICGSLTGILLFTVVSALQLSPFWWFFPVSIGLGIFLITNRPHGAGLQRRAFTAVLLALIPVAANWHTGETIVAGKDGKPPIRYETLWSPYYRVDFEALCAMPSRST